jgi:hypothetical protein
MQAQESAVLNKSFRFSVVLIEGVVSNTSGMPLSHVKILFEPIEGDDFQDTTDADGRYSDSLPYGWSGTAVPYLEGYEFAPDSIIYNDVTTDQTDEDYVGTLMKFIVAGRILDEEDFPVEGLIIRFKDEIGNSFYDTSDSEGNYLVSLNIGWSGEIIPVSNNYTFFPALVFINDLDDDTSGIDFVAFSQPLNILFPEKELFVCEGSSLYSNPQVTGGMQSLYSFSWSSSPEGFSSTSLNPELSVLSDTTIYFLTVNDGYFQEIDSVILIKMSLPTIKMIEGKDEVCRNQAGLVYRIMDVENDESYLWDLPEGGGYIESGENTDKIVVDWANDSGNYKLILSAINSDGCSSASEKEIKIKAANAPLKTSVKRKGETGNILIAETDVADNYQWGFTDKLTGKEIYVQGATDRFCEMPHLNIDKYYYWVDAWWYDSDTGCYSRSYYNVPLVITDEEDNYDLSIYPNPVKSSINIKVNDLMYGKVSIDVINLSGLSLKKLNVVKRKNEENFNVSVEDLMPGLYVVKVFNGKYLQIGKFVKE